MEIKRLFLGDSRVLSFANTLIPEPKAIANVTFDAMTTDCRIVPYSCKNGSHYFCESSPELEAFQALDLVWTLNNQANIMLSCKAIAEYASDLHTYLKATNLHESTRILYSDDRRFHSRERPNLIMIRLFKNDDFDCHEHPEMLSGEPIGTYYCPECANAQVAGLRHMRDAK